MATHTDLMKGFELGPWTVFPERNLIRHGDLQDTLELKVMNVLVVLASHQGEVVSKDQLVDAVWEGRATSDEVITRCISKIRSAFSDDPKKPTYIENVRGRGYRLIAPVTSLPTATITATESPIKRHWRRPIILALIAVAVVAVTLPFLKVDSTDELPIKSVVIMPFKNLSSGEDQYLCEGFTEELVYTLSSISTLKVAKGSAAMINLDYVSLAKKLGVDGVLVGSLRRDGERVRVTVQLHDGRNGFSRWSDVFDDSLNDTFKLQERVAEGVRRAIQGDEVASREVKAQSRNPEAYITYLRAGFLLNQRSPDKIKMAIQLFQEAIAGDPSFGLPYLGKAYAYLLLPSYSGEPVDAMYQLANETIDEGVKQDPSIRDTAAGVRGFIYHKHGKWQRAKAAFETAVSSNRSYPYNNVGYSRFLASVGLLHKSLEQAKLAQQMEPLSPVFNDRLAMSYFWINDLDNAEKYFGISRQLGMSSPISMEANTLLLLRQGRVDDARSLIQQVSAIGQVDGEWIEPVFAAIADPNKRATAIAVFSESIEGGTVSPREQVVLWSMLGETERALETAQLLIGGGEAFEPDLLFIEELAELRKHPAFEKLLADIGLVEFWSGIGCEWRGGLLVCDS